MDTVHIYYISTNTTMLATALWIMLSKDVLLETVKYARPARKPSGGHARPYSKSLSKGTICRKCNLSSHAAAEHSQLAEVPLCYYGLTVAVSQRAQPPTRSSAALRAQRCRLTVSAPDRPDGDASR